MKGDGNNMTEWYGIGKTEDPEAGVCVWYPVEGEQQMANWAFGCFIVLYKSGIRECGAAEHRCTRKARLHVCGCMVAGRRA